MPSRRCCEQACWTHKAYADVAEFVKYDKEEITRRSHANQRKQLEAHEEKNLFGLLEENGPELREPSRIRVSSLQRN